MKKLKFLAMEVGILITLVFNLLAFISGCIVLITCMSEMLFGTLSKVILNKEFSFFVCFWAFMYSIAVILITVMSYRGIEKCVKNHKKIEFRTIHPKRVLIRFSQSLFHLVLLSAPIFTYLALSKGMFNFLVYSVSFLITVGGFAYAIIRTSNTLRRNLVAPT